MSRVFRAMVDVVVTTTVEFEMGIEETESIASIQALARKSAQVLVQKGLDSARGHRRGIQLDPDIKQTISATVATVSAGRTVIE